MQAKARLALFGTVRLMAPGGEDCPLPSAKLKALLAVLALAPGGRLAPEQVMALLWSDRGEAQARDSLKHALAEARQRLAPAGQGLLATSRDVIRLDLTRIALDVAEFESLCADPSAPGLVAACDLLSAELLAGLAVHDPAFEDWLRQERQRLHHLLDAAAGRLLREAELAGDSATAAPLARRLLLRDPTREDAARLLMRHHAGLGERAVALRLYDDLGLALKRELGVAPDGQTQALAQSLRGGEPRVPAPELRAQGRPSIAVLPFRNESGDPGQDYFADGIAEDMITALSRYRWFNVIARNPSFDYRDRKPGLRAIAVALGVRYILDGTVRKSGGRLRLSAELVEPGTGTQVWSDRYDRDLTDIFDIQDELSRQVAGAIEPEILRGESQRARAKSPASLDAYDCHMRGVWHHNLQGDAQDFEEAIRWQRRAIELDPGLARAYMILARSLYARCLYGHSTDLTQDRFELLAAASRAVALESRDAYAHYAMCCAHLIDLNAPAAVIDAERAVELAPNLALAQNALGWARVFAGDFAGAIAPIQAAMRLSPNDPVFYFFSSRLGLAHYHLGNYEEAVRFTQRAMSVNPRYHVILVQLAGLAKLGRAEEVGALLPQTRAAQPRQPDLFWRHIFPYSRPEHRAAMEDGLRKAGFPVA